MVQKTIRAWQGFIVFSLFLLVAACAYTPIAQYRAETERQIIALQQQTDRILTKLNTATRAHKAHGYSIYRTQYQKLDRAVLDFKQQQQAVPHNTLLTKQITALQVALDNLQQLHQFGFKQTKQVDLVRKQLAIIFNNMRHLELSKPRG